MTNDRRKSWYIVVRHHAKVPTTSYIEWQPNSGIKCIFQQLSWTSTYSTKYQNFVQKPICSTDNPPLTRFPLTRYPLMWFSKKQIFSFSQMSVWDFVFNSSFFFETGAIPVPTKSQNPTICDWGGPFHSYLTHS